MLKPPLIIDTLIDNPDSFRPLPSILDSTATRFFENR